MRRTAIIGLRKQLERRVAPRKTTKGHGRRYCTDPIPADFSQTNIGQKIELAKAFSQERSVALMDAGPDHCRWPVDDGDHNPRCCGCPITRISYCAEHARRAFGDA